MNPLTVLLYRLRRRERGSCTAEYLVGTLGACTIAGLLMQVGHSGIYSQELQELMRRALDPSTFIRYLGQGGLIPRIGRW